MSRVEEIQNQIEELEKKKQELQKELEFEKNKYVVAYPFEIPDSYWRLELNGVITKDWWGNDDWERHCYKQGNVFLTEEEAEKEQQRRELLIRFKQYRDKCNGGWKPDFSIGTEYKWCIQKDILGFVAEPVKQDVLNVFGYFKNEEDCIMALRLFEDEIKQLF